MKIMKVICIILGLILLLGMLALPYNYYIFIRFATFSVCLKNLYVSFTKYKKGFKVSLIIVLFMFSALIIWNSFMPIHMTKTVWAIFDGIYGLGFLLYGIFCCNGLITNNKEVK